MAGEVDDALAPGTMLGRYRVERCIGAGAMGAVYLARHTGLGKPVVVKVLHGHYAQSAKIRQRFVREGEAAARIRHAHVVDVTDVGVEGATPYLVMEHLEGESLGDLLERQGALSADRAVDLLLPVIAAVDAAHAAGVVHRDLKPDNLFIARTATGDPLPKVLDFGISRVVSEGDQGNRTGTAAVLGTPAYMAPEQIESARDADALSDQYALGVILYECVTGRPPFEADNVYALLKKVGDGRFSPPRASRPDLDPRLEAVVLRVMAHDRTRRFPSLNALGAALLPFASERTRLLWGTTFHPPAEYGYGDTRLDTTSAPAPVSDTLVNAASLRNTAPAKPKRRRIFAASVAAVVLLVAALTVAVIASITPRRSPATALPPTAAPHAPELVAHAAATPQIAAPAPVPTPAALQAPVATATAVGNVRPARTPSPRREERAGRRREPRALPARDPLQGINVAP